MARKSASTAASSSTVLTATNVHKSYGQQPVLNGIDLTLQAGSTTALVGPSGCGKSTLLHILAGLDAADQGTVTFMGQSLQTMSDRQRTLLRRRNVGMIFQFHHLLPEFNARDNIALSMRLNGSGWREARHVADDLCRQLNIHHRADARPNQLSGGERQRVAIARALCHKPQLVLADEPTGNLDPTSAAEVFVLLQQLVKRHHTALLMVTHNLELANQCQRSLHLKRGHIVEAS